MKNMKIKMLLAVLTFLTYSFAYGESVSVGIDDMEAVFQNYDKESDAGFEALAPKPITMKFGEDTVLASSAAVNLNEGLDKAFDGNANTKYCTTMPTMWVERQFAGGKKQMAAYALTAANDAPPRDPKDWTLQGSNDGKTWDVLDQRSSEGFSKRFERRTFNVQNPGDYSSYRLDVTRNHGADTSQIAEFELLTVDDLKAAEAKPDAVQHGDAGWMPLFADDLSDAEFPAGVWTVSNGEMTASEDRLIMTKKEYENFVLDLEFKNGPAANSGVFVYLTDPAGWVKNSVEIQITDDHAEKWAKANPTWMCGAIFGRLAPAESAVKKAGEWNRYTIICRGPFIEVLLNGVHVNSMDMRRWDSPTHNPDGSEMPPWLSKPINNHPTKGRIGFQGKHGGAPIWFRNIKIKPLN